jgi:hypothetical protein
MALYSRIGIRTLRSYLKRRGVRTCSFGKAAG